MAKVFIILGLIILTIGVILMLFPNAFGWFGKMPGDVAYRSDSGNVRVYFPIVTMIIISIVGSILLNLFMRR